MTRVLLIAALALAACGEAPISGEHATDGLVDKCALALCGARCDRTVACLRASGHDVDAEVVEFCHAQCDEYADAPDNCEEQLEHMAAVTCSDWGER